MKNQKVCILSGYGINADQELAHSFTIAGAKAELVHLEDLRKGITSLESYNALAFPGGFSFGDHLGSGKVLSHIIRSSLRTQIEALVARGGLVIGICNGFQTIAKMGLLPDSQHNWTQEVSLLHNIGGHFIDRWVKLRVNNNNTSPWLMGIHEMTVPMRHGEGRLVVANDQVAHMLDQRNLVAFTYADGAPNGSYRDIAGLTDTTGQILGLMPHPECFLYEGQNPDGSGKGKNPEGLGLFFNAVRFLKENS
jgi:phosphoribosylformylglycinamidine synthase subunit PurQ / glutaminase